MHVSVADRWRSTLSEVTEGESATDMLDQGLVGANLASGQIEIVCDKEFFDKLAAEQGVDPAPHPWHDGHQGFFRGVPLMVSG